MSWAGVLLAVASNVSAGLSLPPLVLDPDSSIDASSQRPCRYTGDFTQQRHLEELKSPLVSSGSFMFSCDAGLLWEVRKPIFDARVYTFDNLNYRIQKNGNVSQLVGIGNAKTASLLLDLLGGNTSALSEEFDLVDDERLPAALVLRPKQRMVQKRLSQLIVQQQDDTVTITIQAPATGDYVITIDNIAIFEGDDVAACQQFSQQPSPGCSVLTVPEDYSSKSFDTTK